MEVAPRQAVQYNMLAQNCYSSWFDIPVAFFLLCVLFFIYCRLVRCSHGLLFLVDPLEALCVLHSHEEFLSQVLEGVVSGQVQAVETGGEKYKI